MEQFLGQICLFPYNFTPRGWAFCNGQLLSIAQNTALFSLIGTIYGGDGVTTFGLPDLRGRVPIHSGNGYAGPGLSSYVPGEIGGVENVTLLTTQMPQHNHVNMEAASGTESKKIANESFLMSTMGASDYDMETIIAHTSPNSTTTHIAGGSQPHENRQPYLALNYCIALEGIFPSRD